MNFFAEKYFLPMTFYAFMVWALFTFTAFSASALGHILLFIPGVYFTYLFWKNREGKMPLSSWALLGLVIISVISIFLNTSLIAHPGKNLFKLKYFIIAYLGIPATFYLWINYLNTRRLRLLLNTFLVTSAIASASGLIGLASGFNPLRFKAACHATRACGMYGMYMSYGYGIQFVVLLLLGVLLFKNELIEYFNEKIAWVSFIINGAGLFFSYTRGGWIGFLFGAVLLLFFKNKKWFVVTLLLGVLGFSGLVKFNDNVHNMFFSKTRQYSNDVRVSQWKASYEAFKEHPIWGVGFRNFEPLSGKIKKEKGIEFPNFFGHAHNNFIEHLASTGILGFISLTLFHFFWFWEALRSRHSMGWIMASIVVALTISGQFQYSLGDGENLFVIMAFYMLFSSKLIEKQQEVNC